MTNKIQTTFRLAFGALAFVAVGSQFSLHLSAGHSALNFFSFFTNLSNLLAALVFVIGAARQMLGRPSSSGFDTIRTAAVINMVVVGVVFALLLRNVDLGDLRPWVNTVVHYVMPIAVLAEFLLWPPRGRASFKQLVMTLCFPMLYLLYVLIRGASTGWYPYPFLNPNSMNGYGAMVPYVIGIMLLFVSLAWLLTRLASRIAVSQSRVT